MNVVGYCPMGCGSTLFVGEGGFVTCSWVDCPKPDAASETYIAYPGSDGQPWRYELADQ